MVITGPSAPAASGWTSLITSTVMVLATDAVGRTVVASARASWTVGPSPMTSTPRLPWLGAATGGAEPGAGTHDPCATTCAVSGPGGVSNRAVVNDAPATPSISGPASRRRAETVINGDPAPRRGPRARCPGPRSHGRYLRPARLAPRGFLSAPLRVVLAEKRTTRRAGTFTA